MSQSNWPEEGRPYDQGGPPPHQQWSDQPPPPAGMSGGMKACLIIICVVGCCCLLCCGGVIYLGYSFYPRISENPADIAATRDEIATIDIPAGLKPKGSFKIDNAFVSMPGVVYEDPKHAVLLMGEIKKSQWSEQLAPMMRERFEQQRTVEVGRMENSKTETKTIKIKGKDCEFVFTTGEERDFGGGDGKKPPKKSVHHEIAGTFDGKDGPAMIVINFDDTYKEADFVKMLENIR
jgi:hypothetical protein